MALFTQCILHPSPEDVMRISVMSRHTLNDGKTPHPDIREECYDEWWKELAPPPKLIGDYYKRDLPWALFIDRFNDHLFKPEVMESLHKLIDLASQVDVTIMCVEEDPTQCHRRLIAEACKVIRPDLDVHIQ